jgi:hypothetical protein
MKKGLFTVKISVSGSTPHELRLKQKNQNFIDGILNPIQR